ncbi:MAG TPA: hypothetical protein VF778_14785 [Xanthobacteraceae bacterium]
MRRRDCSAATADFGNSGNNYSGSWLCVMHKESLLEIQAQAWALSKASFSSIETVFMQRIYRPYASNQRGSIFSRFRSLRKTAQQRQPERKSAAGDLGRLIDAACRGAYCWKGLSA